MHARPRWTDEQTNITPTVGQFVVTNASVLKKSRIKQEQMKQK